MHDSRLDREELEVEAPTGRGGPVSGVPDLATRTFTERGAPVIGGATDEASAQRGAAHELRSAREVGVRAGQRVMCHEDRRRTGCGSIGRLAAGHRGRAEGGQGAEDQRMNSSH